MQYVIPEATYGAFGKFVCWSGIGVHFIWRCHRLFFALFLCISIFVRSWMTSQRRVVQRCLNCWYKYVFNPCFGLLQVQEGLFARCSHIWKKDMNVKLHALNKEVS